MRRSQLLEQASEKFGRQVFAHHLSHAQSIGAVDKPPIVAGWQRFSQEHVTQLVTYMKKHSRGPLSSVEASSL